MLFCKPRIILAALIMIGSLCSQVMAVEYNINDFGATPGGKEDATSAIQKALDEAGKSPGSIVTVPAGVYLVAGSIAIPGNVTLKGEKAVMDSGEGSVLLSTFGKGKSDGPGCIMVGASAHVESLVIRYPEQVVDGDNPIAYPYAITCDQGGYIEKIFLLNPYQGINLDFAHASTVRDVWGEPLRIGINADHIFDVCRIENVHFWPFYTNSKPGLRKWVQENGVAFQFGRSDWQMCANTFCYGYHTGYRFYRSSPVPERSLPGGATNGSFSSIGADSAAIGIDVEDSLYAGISITNAMIAAFGTEDSRGIILREGNTGNVTLTNCNFWEIRGSVAEIKGGSLNMSACNIQKWGVHATQEKLCFIQSGGRLSVNNCIFNRGGFLAMLEGNNSSAIFTGNQSDGNLSIINLIGDKARIGLNNPDMDILSKKPDSLK